MAYPEAQAPTWEEVHARVCPAAATAHTGGIQNCEQLLAYPEAQAPTWEEVHARVCPAAATTHTGTCEEPEPEQEPEPELEAWSFWAKFWPYWRSADTLLSGVAWPAQHRKRTAADKIVTRPSDYFVMATPA